MFASWTWLKFQPNKESCEFDQVIAKNFQYVVQKKMSKEQKSLFLHTQELWLSRVRLLK